MRRRRKRREEEVEGERRELLERSNKGYGKKVEEK